VRARARAWSQAACSSRRSRGAAQGPWSWRAHAGTCLRAGFVLCTACTGAASLTPRVGNQEARALRPVGWWRCEREGALFLFAALGNPSQTQWAVDLIFLKAHSGTRTRAHAQPPQRAAGGKKAKGPPNASRARNSGNEHASNCTWPTEARTCPQKRENSKSGTQKVEKARATLGRRKGGKRGAEARGASSNSGPGRTLFGRVALLVRSREGRTHLGFEVLFIHCALQALVVTRALAPSRPLCPKLHDR